MKMSTACENESELHSGTSDEPRKKKSKSENGKKLSTVCATLNRRHTSMKDQLRDAFINKKHFEMETEVVTPTTVHASPFTCCVLPDFIEDETFLDGLKDELLSLDFNEKSNDLYKFQQSDALQNISSAYISGLRKFLYEDFRSWLRDVTDIEFNSTIDMTCSKYNYTDVLLCHDDELEGRRIAFILYLVPAWSKEDGGLLDLFETDEHFRPTKIVKSLVPRWNTFTFFEVTPSSFHQVSEVLTEDKLRLSISGWFHGTPVSRPRPYVEPHPPLRGHGPLEDGLFVKWTNPCYIDPDSHSQISSTFNEESQIQLPAFLDDGLFVKWTDPCYIDPDSHSQISSTFNEESQIQLPAFLDADCLKELVTVLRGPSITWTGEGPPDRRCYDIAEEESYPLVMKEVLQVLQSEVMFLLLSRLTGLKLHEDIEDSSSDEEDTDGEEKGQKGNKQSNPGCRMEVRRWGHGNYTLVHDTDTVGAEYSLDCNLFIGCEEWSSDYGGTISYIAKGEDEELLSVAPQDNTLALVYKDTDTLSFVKHINHRCTKLTDSRSSFFTVAMVFYE